MNFLEFISFPLHLIHPCKFRYSFLLSKYIFFTNYRNALMKYVLIEWVVSSRCEFHLDAKILFFSMTPLFHLFSSSSSSQAPNSDCLPS